MKNSRSMVRAWMIKRPESWNRVRRLILYWQPVSVGSARLTRSGLPGHPSLRPSIHSFPPSSLNTFVHSSVRSRHSFRFYPSSKKELQMWLLVEGEIFLYKSIKIVASSQLLHTSHERFHLTVFWRMSRSVSSMSRTGRRPMTQEITCSEVIADE